MFPCDFRIKKIIHALAFDYLQTQHKIIEIGAGRLNALGQSYLMQRLPETIISQVEPTDVNRCYTMTELPSNIDTLDMKNIYGENSVNQIIGSAILDTLNAEDLKTTLDQIYQVLKDGGTFIHISSLPPCEDTILSEYSREDSIYFPYKDERGCFVGIRLIEKKSLIRFTDETVNLSTEEKKFLQWFANESPISRESIINELMMNPIRKKTIKQFSNWSTSLMLPSKLIKNKDFFEARLKSALNDTSFKIKEFAYRQQNIIIERPTDFPEQYKGHNYFELMDGFPNSLRCYVLKPEYIYQEVRMHVIVAKVFK